MTFALMKARRLAVEDRSGVLERGEVETVHDVSDRSTGSSRGLRRAERES